KDFVQGRGVPFLLAAIKGRIGNFPETITYEQFLEMKNHPLIQYGNHTDTHLNLSQQTNEEAERQIRECEEFLLEHGIYTSVLIPPFGAITSEQVKIARKFVNSVVITGNGEDVGSLNDVTSGFLDTNRVVRIDF